MRAPQFRLISILILLSLPLSQGNSRTMATSSSGSGTVQLTGYVASHGSNDVNTFDTRSDSIMGGPTSVGADSRALAGAADGKRTYESGTPQLPTVQFSVSHYAVNESAGAANIQVLLDASSTSTVTVEYATSDGTATAGEDYELASGTLVFNPDETAKSFAIPIICDAISEPVETVNLTLSSPMNATLGSPSSATLNILPSCGFPPSARFSSASYSVDEGVESATITVTLSVPSAFVITVNYATADGTASAPDDYADVAGTLVYSPGQTTQTFSVPINDDLSDEPAEVVNLALSSFVNAVMGAPSTATLSIQDDDDPPAVQFSSSSYTIHEGAGTVNPQVILSASSSFTVTVDYATSDGTATAGEDYESANGTLIFDPGETSKPITVPIICDAIDEQDETANLTLSNPANAALGSPSSSTLLIVDVCKGINAFYLPVVLHQFP